MYDKNPYLEYNAGQQMLKRCLHNHPVFFEQLIARFLDHKGGCAGGH